MQLSSTHQAETAFIDFYFRNEQNLLLKLATITNPFEDTCVYNFDYETVISHSVGL